MPTTYPTSLDSFANPGAATLEDAAGFYHDEQHANANDAVEALQAKLGISESVPADAPIANAVLASSTAGRSKWRPLASTDFAPGAGFVRIAKRTAAGGSTILLTFTSIPQVFERLLLQWEMKVTNNVGAGLSNVTLQVGFAPSTFAVDAQYSMHRFQTNGSITAAQDTLAATAFVAGFAPQNNVAPGRVGRGIVEFPNYASSGLYKSFIARGGSMLGAQHTAGNYLQWMHFGQYENNTGAIQCIQIAGEGFTMLDGSSAVLWGVPAS